MAASASPREMWRSWARFEDRSGCTSGAPSALASSMVETKGRTSYSTLIRSLAFSASCLVSATMRAMGSPRNLVVSPTAIIASQSFTRWPTVFFPGISSAVNILITPSAFSAWVLSMDRTLALGCFDLRATAWSIPST